MTLAAATRSWIMLVKSNQGNDLVKLYLHRLTTPLIVLLALFASGCSSLGVEVWQRESLAQPEMQFVNDDLDLVLDDHFYFSKEGTSGGRGFAGGGCGCN